MGIFWGFLLPYTWVTKKSLEIRSTLHDFTVGNNPVFFTFHFSYIMITIVFLRFLRKKFIAISDFGHLLNVHFAI